MHAENGVSKCEGSDQFARRVCETGQKRADLDIKRVGQRLHLHEGEPLYNLLSKQTEELREERAQLARTLAEHTQTRMKFLGEEAHSAGDTAQCCAKMPTAEAQRQEMVTLLKSINEAHVSQASRASNHDNAARHAANQGLPDGIAAMFNVFKLS